MAALLITSDTANPDDVVRAWLASLPALDPTTTALIAVELSGGASE